MLDDLKSFIDSRIKEIFNNFSNKDYMISKLQEINKKFITDYKIQINYNNKDLIAIIPIETEIYFSKLNEDNKPDDGMCHMNELQKGKDRFGKLYFHRLKNKKTNLGQKKEDPISAQGGIDICLSNGNYFLSILIRGAYINKNLFCGIKKIQQEVLDILDIKQQYKKIKEDKLEDIIVLSPKENVDKDKNHKFFILQNRIIAGKYSIDGMPLNIIINDENIFNKIDDINNKNIVSAVRTHYKYIRRAVKEFDFNKNLLINCYYKA